MALRDIEWHRPGFRRGFPHRCRVRHWRLAAAAVSLSSFSIAFADCDQDWFSRRAVLLGLASLAGAISRAPAQAAIPMMEEFYQGSGSQVALPKEELQAMEKAYRKAWEKQKSLSITEAASGALTSLNDVPQMLKSGDFDGVRTLLLSPSVGAIGILKSPSRVGGSPYGAWATQCGDSRCESSALIARGALQELEEWCFSKRAIYFNSADKKQVESRDATGKALQKLQENLEEPLEFLEQAKVALEEVARKSG